VAGCSGDKPETLARFRAKHSLNFMLLSDPEFEAIEAYGARRLKHFMGKSALGIVRSSCLIGPDGALRHAWDSVSSRGHAAQALEVLRSLAASAS
jgi:thioredoxin-dependent peroxiredoxin